jgi:hypothetical protein
MGRETDSSERVRKKERERERETYQQKWPDS